MPNEILSQTSSRESQRSANKEPRLLFVGFCALIALAPLPLGSDRPLAWNALGFVAGLLLLGSVFVSHRDLAPIRSDLAVPLFLFSIVVVFVGIQMATVTPSSWHNPLWDQVSTALGRTLEGSISVDRPEGVSHLLRILSYASIFFLAVLFGRSASRAHATLNLVVLSASAYAAYGILEFGSGTETILWFPKWSYHGDLTSTFVNRNSCATYLGLGFLAALSQLVRSFSRLSLYGDRREKLMLIIDFLSARSWLLVALFLLATALVLTHSRGGFISTLTGVLALTCAMTVAPGMKQAKYIRLIALPVAMVLIAFLISGETTVERLLNTTLGSEERIVVFRLTWLAIQDNPLLGTGLGSFASVFPLYQSAEITSRYDMLHNDYLQNTLELGIPAAICLYSSLFWLIGLCVRGILTRRRSVAFPCLGLGASFLVGVHALVDFSMQIPAITALYLVLLGIGVAQSRSARAASGLTD